MTDVSYECVGFATQGVDRIVIVIITRLLQSLPMDIRGMYVVQMKQSEWNRVYYLCEKGDFIGEPELYQCKIAISYAGYLILDITKVFVANSFLVNNIIGVSTVYLAV